MRTDRCETKGIPWTTGGILKATSGRLLCGNEKESFAGVSIDSRNIAADELFVAIVGETHDGHRFIPDAIRKGVRGVLVCAERFKPANRASYAIDAALYESWGKRGIVFIAVPDTVQALGRLAQYQRMQADVSVIAITGSNGKTTTKEMTAGVLKQRFNTLATSGNFNNEIGMPITLLKLKHDHQWAVIELGMNHPGEIEKLGMICRPDIGIITNVAPAHLAGLGSIEGVARAKGELLKTIRPGGTAVLNADDTHVRKLASEPYLKDRLQRVVSFGLAEDAHIRAESVYSKGIGTSFTLVLPNDRITVDLKIPGRFMVSNALAAAAAGYLCGLDAHEIKTGLERFTAVPGRMHVIDTAKGFHIIDDTYNANPGSMKAAIMTLKSLKGRRNGFMAVGDMYELGPEAEAGHENIGWLAGQSGISGLFATGSFAATVAKGARRGGLGSECIFTGNREDIAEHLIKRLGPGDWVLVKGSRAMGMEKIVQQLVNWGNEIHS